eukprot:jgi/Undpi1/12745/HiC_scaffold_6.g02413.m1
MSVRREISANLWFVARLCETGKFRALFHPAHFERLPHETLQEAMIARRAELQLDAPAALAARSAPSVPVSPLCFEKVHDVKLVVKRGEVPLRIYVPSTSPKGTSRASNAVVFWMHGGGWMFGSLEAHDTISQDLATASGMIVVSVGYRLSPEVKFPVPIQDCLAAVQWVKKNIWAFGGDRTRMALVGESSGANLALATGYGLEGSQMKGYWDNYLRKKSDGLRPLASPLRASKRMLHGLPPILLLRAEHEILWDEISQMGQNLANAGQEVEEFQSKGCIHGTFAKGVGSCGVDSLQNAADFIKKHCK